MREEYFLIDSLINIMTKTEFINTGIQTLATGFMVTAGVLLADKMYLWAVVCAFICAGLYALYELLP